jgi:hypothetical protein
MAEKFVPFSEDVGEWQVASNGEEADLFSAARVPSHPERLDLYPTEDSSAGLVGIAKSYSRLT